MLGLKGSQSALYEAVNRFFAVAQAGKFTGVDHLFYEEVHENYGRLGNSPLLDHGRTANTPQQCADDYRAKVVFG